MQGFKSAILAIFQFWQNGTFVPVHGIQKKIEKRYEDDMYKEYS